MCQVFRFTEELSTRNFRMLWFYLVLAVPFAISQLTLIKVFVVIGFRPSLGRILYRDSDQSLFSSPITVLIAATIVTVAIVLAITVIGAKVYLDKVISIQSSFSNLIGYFFSHRIETNEFISRGTRFA
jgi:hypothetical protein